MKKCLISMMFAVLFGSMTNGYGEQMAEEHWEGTLKRPSKKAKHVTFVVKRTGGKPGVIEMNHEGTIYPFKDVEMNDRELTFSWTPGKRGDIDCLMVKQDNGAFEGKCPLSDSDKNLKMTMRPSKVEN